MAFVYYSCLLIILQCLCSSLCSREFLVAQATLENALNILNSRNESSFMYKSPIVTNIYPSWQNESTGSSVGQIEIRIDRCNTDGHPHCSEAYVICQFVKDGNVTNVSSCAEKENYTHFLGSHSDHMVVANDLNIEKYLESIIEVDEPETKGYTGATEPNTKEQRPTERAKEPDTNELRPVAIEEPIIAKQAFCSGCPVDLNVNNPDLHQFVDQALSAIDIGSENLYKHGLLRIHKAQRQVVNGIIYMLLMDVGETTCLKEMDIDRNLCSFELKSSPTTCYVEIFERPGLQKQRKVVYNNCTDTDNSYPDNEIDSHTSGTSISNVENAPTNSITNVRNQFGSLDDLAAATPNERAYDFADSFPDYYIDDSSTFEGVFPYMWAIDSYFTELGEDSNVRQNSRAKREDTLSLNKGLKAIGPEEKDLVNELATTAIETLDDIDEDDLKRVILDIVDAKKEITGGLMYHLRLIVGTTSCEENGPTSAGCRQEFVLPPSLCTVHLLRSFVDNSPRVQVVWSECVPKERESPVEEFIPRNIKGVPDNVLDLDFRLPHLLKVSQFALSEMNSRLHSKYTLLGIPKVHIEVQDAIKTYFTIKIVLCLDENEPAAGCRHAPEEKLCSVEVIEQPSPETMQLVKFVCGDSVVHEKKAKHNLLEVPSATATSDPYIKKMVDISLAELDRRSNSLYRHKLLRILSAETQVIAGRLVHLRLEVAETMCNKENENSAEECSLKNSLGSQVCEIKVWDRIWLEDQQVKQISCSPASQQRRRRSSKRRLVGAAKEIDLDDPGVKNATAFAVTELDKQSNSAFKRKATKVMNAKIQVVAGVLYHLTIEIGETNCLKRTNENAEECDWNQDSKLQICNVKVLVQVWSNHRELSSSHCTEGPQLRRRRYDVSSSRSLGVLEMKFQEFASKYNKTYKNEEEKQTRFHIFKANMMKIQRLQETEQGTAKYGVTQFTDLTKTEFKQKYLGLNPALKKENEVPMSNAKIPDIELPVEFDWRHYNVVTVVKNQGMCGSCWAFSVTGNVEGQWALHKRELVSLSEQELVDCDAMDEGCNGGLMDNAYRAIEKLGGLETERDYPYEGDDEKCHFNRSDVRVTIQGAVNISSNETKMAQWLVKNGPISIGINANAMQFYLGGVSHPWKFLCDPEDLDHGVLIVGFGVHKTYFRHRLLPYWIIKNSWGSYWGEKGYYRVFRGDGTCGVNMMASSALVD